MKKVYEEKLKMAHKDLQLIFLEYGKNGKYEIGISEVVRTQEKQMMLYKSGASKIDGVTKKSKHQSVPSLAVDIFIIKNGKADWNDRKGYITIYYEVLEIAKNLKKSGSITHNVRWGGNWDMDDEILTDQKFNDLVHFELV